MSPPQDEQPVSESVVFRLPDNADPARPARRVEITKTEAGFLEIAPEGYGEHDAEPGEGCPILLEYYEGELTLHLAEDINQADFRPASLEGAREDCRKKGQSDG